MHIFPHFALDTVINFDDVADGAVIDAHYSPQGVFFTTVLDNAGHTASAYARAFSGSASLPNVVSVNPAPYLPLFDVRFGAIEATFTSPQQRVSIDAQPVAFVEALGTTANAPFLEVYGPANALLGHTFYPLAYGDPMWGQWRRLAYDSGSANITKVRFSCEHGNGFPVYAVFDSLIFGQKLHSIPIGWPHHP